MKRNPIEVCALRAIRELHVHRRTPCGASSRLEDVSAMINRRSPGAALRQVSQDLLRLSGSAEAAQDRHPPRPRGGPRRQRRAKAPSTRRSPTTSAIPATFEPSRPVPSGSTSTAIRPGSSPRKRPRTPSQVAGGAEEQDAQKRLGRDKEARAKARRAGGAEGGSGSRRRQSAGRRGMIEITVFTKDGGPLTKQLSLSADGGSSVTPLRARWRAARPSGPDRWPRRLGQG